jgi:PAS domain-containing protein
MNTQNPPTAPAAEDNLGSAGPPPAAPSGLDFQQIFEATPDSYLVLAADFTILAANDIFLRNTLREREHILGRPLFEAFPENPEDAGATGVRNMRASLERVLATRAPDTMAVQKYDIRGPAGPGSPGGEGVPTERRCP